MEQGDLSAGNHCYNLFKGQVLPSSHFIKSHLSSPPEILNNYCQATPIKFPRRIPRFTFHSNLEKEWDKDSE